MSAWHNLGASGWRSALWTWLSKIAAHRDSSKLRAGSKIRRAASALPGPVSPEPTRLGPTGTSAEPPWLKPYPDVLLDSPADQVPVSETRYTKAEATSLAFNTALQLLPPVQRAALILRDVLGYQAAEVAGMLDITQEAIDGALPHARATVDNHLADCAGNGSCRSNGTGYGSRRPPPRPDPDAENRLVARLIVALERSDLDALLRLFVADVRLSIPPAMLEYRGIEQAQRVFATVAFRPGRSYHVVPTRANGQPAFGVYLADPHASVYRPYALLVITITGDFITAITVFSPDIMPRFGLPRTLPQAD